MIPIRPRAQDIPPTWLERAERVQAEVATCVDDPGCDADDAETTGAKSARKKRALLFEKHADLWSELKPVLARWSYNKCWYTEARDVVSDYHVDHFRPKGRIRAHPDKPTNAREEGYWWLVFDWRNYRLAGAWSNSPHRIEEEGESLTIGKWNYFPLLNERFMATEPQHDHTKEQALLLDPLNPADTSLVTFNETGRAKPAMSSGPTADRVETAAKILGLNAPLLLEERRRKWNEVVRLIEAFERYANLPDEERSPHWQAENEAHIIELMKLTAPDAEFSATARACVRAHAHYLVEQLPPLDGRFLADPGTWAVPAVAAVVTSSRAGTSAEDSSSV